MKKLILIALLFAACTSKNNNGTYVNHTEGQFSVVDDTLIMADTVIINHSGYQKIRDGQKVPKAFKTRKWNLNSPDAPPIIIRDGQVQLGSTIYTKLP